jgi:serine/threonine protein kinase/tetratricopeptide (TPR) repeat protein
MRAERWQQIKQLFHQARELAPGLRTAFVEERCSHDPELRREVISLLEADQEPHQLIDQPAYAAAADLINGTETGTETRLLNVSNIDRLAGKTIGPYRIEREIGRGGMGEVYRARDTRLDRPVAVKVLPAYFAQDRDRVRRFQQEARSASSLNHPNIVTIHEIGESDGLWFIVSELVEGKTLRQLIAAGGIGLDQALDILVQLASALGAAHSVGVVHRDIKPENIMVRKDGFIKVLDFGLAKLTGPREAPDGGHRPQTASNLSEFNTKGGLIMGTAKYMSPEQARGQKIDNRTDIFSLGVVLYETITGRAPFDGETSNHAIVAILEREPPPIAGYRPDAPAELQHTVNRALRKDRDERYNNAGEVLSELQEIRQRLQVQARQGPAAGLDFREIQTATQFSPQLRSPSAPAPDAQPIVRPEVERRQAAILCSSVAGYSALVEQLAPEEIETIVARIRGALIEVVQKHGGVVNQVSGEEMTALFGIPATGEDDFVRAVRAGLEFHTRVRELTKGLDRRLGESTGMRTGVHTGPVVMQGPGAGEREYRVTGDAVRIASRLASLAGIDNILVSRETERLIAPFFRTEPRETLSLEPGSAPVMTYRVACDSGVQTRIEAAEARGLTRYTGRAKELVTLQTILEKAITGQGQFVTVVGEAGAGKSRLLLEFCSSLEKAPITVLKGRCQSYGGNVPYHPFLDLLKSVLTLRDGDSPAERLSAAITGIRAIDPNLEDYLPLFAHLLSLESDEHSLPSQLQGEDLRFAILEALSAIFTLKTRSGGVLILLEDWHWADEGSEQALKKLAGMAPAYPLMIIATCRPERPFSWGYATHHTQLHLGPLDASPSISIMKSIFGADVLPAGLGESLYRRTGGNPFFIEEVCRNLIENGRVQVVDRVPTLSGPVEDLNLPDTVQAVIRARLDRLDSETQRALRHAAVIGREFNRPILEQMFQDRSRLPRCLESLQTLGLIHQTRVLPEATYQFNHILTQEVAYAGMLLRQRRTLHEAAGRAIEDLYEGRLEERFDLLAYHFSRAEDWAKAARYGRESAERAGKLIQLAEALRMLEQVEGWLLKLPETPERLQSLINVVLQQERLCETLGFRERQQALIDRIVSLLYPDGDRALLAEVYIRQGELYTLLKRFVEAEPPLSESLAIWRSLSDRTGERHALRSLGFLYWHQGRYEDALACNQSALEIDRAMNDSAGYMQDLTNIGSVLRSRGAADKALEHLNEALQISESLGRSSFQTYVLSLIGTAHRDLGQVEAAMQCYQRAIGVTRQNRLHLQQLFLSKNMANLCWEQDRIEESLRIYAELVSTTRSLDIKSELAQALGVYGQRLMESGKVEDASPHLVEAAELFSQLGDRENELLVLISLARIYEQSPAGYDQSLAAWSRIRDLRKERNEPAGVIEALKQMARLARQGAGDRGSALGHLSEASDLAAGAGDAACQGEMLNSMGIIEWEQANYSSALAHYEKALEIFEGLDDRVHAGLMLNSIGVTLKAMGRLDEARSRLEEAIRVHRASGQRLLEGHALAAIADLCNESGQLDRAADHYLASLEIRRELGDRQGEGWMLYNLARVYAATGAPERSRDLLGQSLVIAGELGSKQLKEACGKLEV